MSAIGAIGAVNSIGALGSLQGSSGLGAGAAGIGAAGGPGGPASPAGGAGASSVAGQQAGGGDSFMNALGQAFDQLNAQVSGADAAAASFASGGNVDIGDAMLAMSEASIGLKVGISVRDKLLEAYQEIMRLQV